MWNQRQVSQVSWTHSCSLCSTPCWVSRTRNQSNFRASCGSSCTPLAFSSRQPSVISSGPLCCYWCFLIPNETRGRGSITPECPEGVWCVSSQFLPKLSPHLCCPVFGTQNAEIFLCHYCIPLAHGGHIPFLLTTLLAVVWVRKTRQGTCCRNTLSVFMGGLLGSAPEGGGFWGRGYGCHTLCGGIQSSVSWARGMDRTCLGLPLACTTCFL